MPVPTGSRSLAFVSQFVEIADDVVFTVKYSVWTAKMVVCHLLRIERSVPAATAQDRSLRVTVEPVIKACR